MNKKIIALVGLILTITIVGGVYTYNQLTRDSNEANEPNKQKITEPLNVIPVEERPYLQIVPEADGNNITIVVQELKKPANEMEYELEYQAGTLLQGIFGSLMLDTLPAEVTELMGSCSAGGACTHHQDIKGGTLLTRYDGPDNYALKSDWKYIENTDNETEISSKDVKFQLSSEDLAEVPYIVVFNTAGYPEGLEGTPVSDPYSLTTSATNLSGSGELTMRAEQEGDLQIVGWNGQEWVEFESQVDPEDGKMVTAEVELMELYLVVN